MVLASAGRAVITALLLTIALVVAVGVWRRFPATYWIWSFFGVAVVMLLLWLILIVTVVGPEMRRTAPLLGR